MTDRQKLLEIHRTLKKSSRLLKLNGRKVAKIKPYENKADYFFSIESHILTGLTAIEEYLKICLYNKDLKLSQTMQQECVRICKYNGKGRNLNRFQVSEVIELYAIVSDKIRDYLGDDALRGSKFLEEIDIRAIELLLENIEGWKSSDTLNRGSNSFGVGLSDSEIRIIIHSLRIVMEYQSQPKWSLATQKQLKAVAEVLREATAVIPKPLRGAWNGAITAIEELFRSAKFSDVDDE